MSPGRKLAILLNDSVCRYLLAGAYSSVAQATSQDPELPTPRPSREQVGGALRRLELADVIETHKGGGWTMNAAELADALAFVDQLPAGARLLENLAHPVGWSVVALLALGHRTRGELNDCGDAARVSEQLRSLRRAGAILDRHETIVLLEPAKHLDLLDLLDRIAGNLHMRAFQDARENLFNPLSRIAEGRRYAQAPSEPRPSESSEARKAYNYTRAAYARSRSRA
jgi:hypothetical protein